MVASVMIHGKMIRPVTAKISQLFSQRHAGIRFIGAAKLPFKRPASTTRLNPTTACSVIGSPAARSPVSSARQEQKSAQNEAYTCERQGKPVFTAPFHELKF